MLTNFNNSVVSRTYEIWKSLWYIRRPDSPYLIEDRHVNQFAKLHVIYQTAKNEIKIIQKKIYELF